MDSTKGRHTIENEAGQIEENISELEAELIDIDPVEIGTEAKQLDIGQTLTERARLPRSTIRRLGYLGIIYFIGLAVMVPFFDTTTQAFLLPLIPTIVILAFLFELMDSAAGMGFGTALAPLLFILGYTPLEVTPVLLISESITGFVSGGVHHELKNASFSFRPLNAEAKTMFLLGSVGAIASVVSIILTYFAFSLPELYIETYVSLLVLGMGLIGLIRARIDTKIKYKPRRLATFAVLAGIN